MSVAVALAGVIVPVVSVVTQRIRLGRQQLVLMVKKIVWIRIFWTAKGD